MDKPVDGAEVLAREVLARVADERGYPAFGGSLRESEPTNFERAIVAAMLAHSAALVAENERLSVIADQAQFLCDRLDELDWSQNLIGITRDFCGHVDPPLHHLKTALETRNG